MKPYTKQPVLEQRSRVIKPYITQMFKIKLFKATSHTLLQLWEQKEMRRLLEVAEIDSVSGTQSW